MHSNVPIRLNNLATLLQATNRLGEAEPLMRRALATRGASGLSIPCVAKMSLRYQSATPAVTEFHSLVTRTARTSMLRLLLLTKSRSIAQLRHEQIWSER